MSVSKDFLEEMGTLDLAAVRPKREIYPTSSLGEPTEYTDPKTLPLALKDRIKQKRTWAYLTDPNPTPEKPCVGCKDKKTMPGTALII